MPTLEVVVRWCLVLLLFAGCPSDGPAPSDHTHTDSGAPPVDATCATWEDFACETDHLSYCFAECLPDLRIHCDKRECFLSGKGQGGGRGCVVSVGDRQNGCGFCETAWKECL